MAKKLTLSEYDGANVTADNCSKNADPENALVDAVVLEMLKVLNIFVSVYRIPTLV